MRGVSYSTQIQRITMAKGKTLQKGGLPPVRKARAFRNPHGKRHDKRTKVHAKEGRS